jgi:hypothetical protein
VIFIILRPVNIYFVLTLCSISLVNLTCGSAAMWRGVTGEWRLCRRCRRRDCCRCHQSSKKQAVSGPMCGALYKSRMLLRLARLSTQLSLYHNPRCSLSIISAVRLSHRLPFSTRVSAAMSSAAKPGIFYRKPLPNPPCIPFSSDQGRKIFQEALAAGSLNCFFPLSEQFLTQDDPAFCGLSSMAMVMPCTMICIYTTALTAVAGAQRAQHRPGPPVEGRMALVQRVAASGPRAAAASCALA